MKQAFALILVAGMAMMASCVDKNAKEKVVESDQIETIENSVTPEREVVEEEILVTEDSVKL
jgi:hypothetical protein